MFQADLPQILQGYGILIQCRARERGHGRKETGADGDHSPHVSTSHS